MKFIQAKRCGVRKNLYLLGKRIVSWKNTKIDVYEYAKSIGVKLGKNVRFITLPNAKYPISWPVFASEPFLVEIGDDCVISFNTVFITHDGSIDIFKKYIDENERNNVATLGKIKVGNNCFIGCNTTIMPNVEIGDNSIIGAGSVVTKNIPEGEVWAGCPAKFIKKTAELAQKYTELSRNQEMSELKELYNNGYKEFLNTW